MKKCQVCGAEVMPQDLKCTTCGNYLNNKMQNTTQIIFIAVLISMLVLSIGAALLIFRTSSVTENKQEQPLEQAVDIIDDIQPDAVQVEALEDADLIEKGITEYLNGNYDGAIELLLEATNRELEREEKFDVFFYLADSYYYLDSYEDAIINYHKALEEEFDYLTTVYLAQTYYLVDDASQAEKYFDEAFRIDEERVEAYIFYSEYLYNAGDLQLAEKNALIALEKSTVDLYPAELLVYIYYDQGNQDLMNKYYKLLQDNGYEYVERITDYINQ